jgi:hypothetical protein
MATRSRIGIELSNGEIHSIYCHWDGSPSYNGEILKKHYNAREKVMELIMLGDISSLRQRVAPKRREMDKHSFDTPITDVVIAYHRDRGEDYAKPRVNADRKEYKNSDIEEWGYLFTKQNKWVVAENNYKGKNRLSKLETYLNVSE